MKITKSKLQSIIKEEVSKLFEVKYVVAKPSQPLEKRFLQARKAGKMGEFGSMEGAAVFGDKNYGDFLVRKYGGEVQEKPESLDEITADQKMSHEKLVARAMELLAQSRKTDDIDKKEALMADARKLLDQAMGVEREAALNEDGHDDLPSAVRKLKTAMEDAHEILAGLQHHQGELPAWWMSKVTIAADYLNKARDYFLVSGELMEEEEMEERKLTPGEKESLTDLEKKVPMKDFIDQYGEKEGKSIYYATLTKMAKKKITEQEKVLPDVARVNDKLSQVSGLDTVLATINNKAEFEQLLLSLIQTIGKDKLKPNEIKQAVRNVAARVIKAK